jgi:hypothetical protein
MREQDAPFGGVTMLFAGDMQQLLPVHRFARDPAAYCIKACSWYRSTIALKLSVNVRACNDTVWADFVAGVGKGMPAVFPSSCMVPDIDALTDAVWPGRHFTVTDNRSVLAMTREDAQTINNRVIDKFIGDPDCALSLDAPLVSVFARFSEACVVIQIAGLSNTSLPHRIRQFCISVRNSRSLHRIEKGCSIHVLAEHLCCSLQRDSRHLPSPSG